MAEKTICNNAKSVDKGELRQFASILNSIGRQERAILYNIAVAFNSLAIARKENENN